MKKEDWINSILESTSEINEVDANPFLYPKIISRLSPSGKDANPILKFSIGWAVGLSIVIAVNITVLCIYQLKIQKQNESAAIEALSNEMTSNTTYNY
jgi:hypothetical protein